MNADYNIGHHINRQNLYEAVVGAGLVCSYHPSIYPAVKTYYMWRLPRDAGHDDGGNREVPSGVCPAACGGLKGGCCKKVTVLAFYTGAVIITGAVERAQIDAAFEWIRRVILETDGVIESRVDAVASRKSQKSQAACRKRPRDAVKPEPGQPTRNARVRQATCPARASPVCRKAEDCGLPRKP
jgi:hypothetical protein